MTNEIPDYYEYFAEYLPTQLAFAFQCAWKYRYAECPSADLTAAEWWLTRPPVEAQISVPAVVDKAFWEVFERTEYFPQAQLLRWIWNGRRDRALECIEVIRREMAGG